MKTTKEIRWFISHKESDVVRKLKLANCESIIDQISGSYSLTPEEAYKVYTENLKRYFLNGVHKVEKSSGINFPHRSKERGRLHDWKGGKAYET